MEDSTHPAAEKRNNTRAELGPDGAAQRMMSVAVTLEPSFRAGTPRVVLTAEQLSGAVENMQGADPDGERFLFLGRSGGDGGSLVFVLNWTIELEGRLATN